MQRPLFSLLIASASLFSAHAARAQASPAARLEVTSAPGSDCLDAQDLGAQVEARLGRPVFQGDARLLVRVSLQPKAPRGWVARLELLNTRGELFGAREIATEAQRCRELDSSLALVTALLVDSPAATEAAESEAEPAPPPPSPPPPPPPRPEGASPPESDAEPAKVESFRVTPSASFAALFGHVPRPLFGVRVGLEVKPPGFIDFGVEATLYGVRDVPDEDFDVSAEIAHGSVGFWACPWTLEGTVEIGVCLGQEITYTTAKASGFDVNQEPTRLGTNTFGRLTLDTPVFFPLRVKAGLTGGVPLVRDRYIFSGPDQQIHEFFRTGSFIVIGQLGLAVRLP
jgi:hypothetical protein